MQDSLYLDLQKRSNQSYNKKRVVHLIIIIKHHKSPAKIQWALQELFYCLSKITIKAINNFLNLIKTVEKTRILHDENDITSECYIIMAKCVEKLDFKRLPDLGQFYFYYNNALNKGVYRIFKSFYYSNKMPVDFEAFIDDSNSDFNTIIDNANFKKNKCKTNDFDTTFSVDLVRFTDLECDIIRFKISGEKLNKFLSEKKITNKLYYDSLKNIKNKLKTLYHDNS